MCADEQIISNIRKLIDEQGVKQRAVAEKAGIPVPLFYSITSGRKKLPATAIPGIAKALNVTPNDLYFKHERSKPHETTNPHERVRHIRGQ